MNDETQPKLKAPPGTCDTHIHVYDHRYPKAPTKLPCWRLILI